MHVVQKIAKQCWLGDSSTLRTESDRLHSLIVTSHASQLAPICAHELARQICGETNLCGWAVLLTFPCMPCSTDKEQTQLCLLLELHLLCMYHRT